MSTPQFPIDPTEPFDTLAKAPIVEAVIHWRAPHGCDVDPNELLSQLQERLPEYPHSQRQQEVGLEAKVGPEVSDLRQRRVWHGFRLETEDRRYVAQFTRNGFVFSRLEPYENWEAFRTEAERLWDIYCELTSPAEVTRLGVRFINQIPLSNLVEINELLARPPMSPEGMDLPISGFMHQDAFELPGYPYQLNVIQTIQPSGSRVSGAGTLILDLDVYTTSAVEHDGITAKLQQMRWIKNKAFFSFLSSRAIERFKE